MPITYQKKRTVLSGVCTVEEADTLLAWLLKNPSREVDVTQAEHLHMAVVQALLSQSAPVTGQPVNPFFAHHVRPQLEIFPESF